MALSNEATPVTKERRKILESAEKVAGEVLAVRFDKKRLPKKTVKEVAQKMAKAIPPQRLRATA